MNRTFDVYLTRGITQIEVTGYKRSRERESSQIFFQVEAILVFSTQGFNLFDSFPVSSRKILVQLQLGNEPHEHSSNDKCLLSGHLSCLAIQLHYFFANTCARSFYSSIPIEEVESVYYYTYIGSLILFQHDCNFLNSFT